MTLQSTQIGLYLRDLPEVKKASIVKWRISVFISGVDIDALVL